MCVLCMISLLSSSIYPVLLTKTPPTRSHDYGCAHWFCGDRRARECWRCFGRRITRMSRAWNDGNLRALSMNGVVVRVIAIAFRVWGGGVSLKIKKLTTAAPCQTD